MLSDKITAEQAAADLDQLLNEVALGRSFFITRDGEIVAQLEEFSIELS